MVGFNAKIEVYFLNLYNLQTLKILFKTIHGRIKCIKEKNSRMSQNEKILNLESLKS